MVVPAANPSSRRNRTILSSLGGRSILFLAALAVLSFLAFKYATLEEVSRHQDPRVGKPKVTFLEGSAGGPRVATNIKLCIAAVERLIQLNIHLVALDFDLTIVDIHTGGAWQSTPHALVPHIRPQMKCLIETALQKGLHLAVASFSIQEQLIQETIKLGIRMGQNMTVRGGKNWSDPNGKRKQLAAATSYVAQSSGEANLSPSNAILIDDDKNNIRIAEEDGFYSLWFDPDKVEIFFNSIISLKNT